MTGIFKFESPENRKSMRQLGCLAPLLLIVGMVLNGIASAELTASQPPQLRAFVGETAMVTVTLTYRGANALQATVMPAVPNGVITDMPYGQTVQLNPGISAPVSYSLRAEQSGTYNIASQIAYNEEGMARELRLESIFTAIDQRGPPSGGSPSMSNDMPAPTNPHREKTRVKMSSDEKSAENVH
jgi:hypothetical protein